MAQTYSDHKNRKDHFNALADRIAAESAEWVKEAKDGGIKDPLTQMPESFCSIVREAAAAGFLYDFDGSQILNFDEHIKPAGMIVPLYLHEGDQTFCIFDDPRQNSLTVSENDPPHLLPEKNVYTKFRPAVPQNEEPEVKAPQVNITKDDYQDQFIALRDRIAEANAAWIAQAEKNHFTGGVTQMPEELCSLAQEAAAAGFLYNSDGKQIWTFANDPIPAELALPRYLHCGDTTYYILNDPRRNMTVSQEDGLLHMPPIPDMRVDFTTTEPKGNQCQKPEKPELNGFWSFMDSVCRFFTGGKYGLPSMNAYDRAQADYEKEEARLARQQNYRSLQNELKEEMQPEPQPEIPAEKGPDIRPAEKPDTLPEVPSEKRGLRPQKLRDALYDYMGNDNNPLPSRKLCTNLCDAFITLWNEKSKKELGEGPFNDICDTLACFFLGEKKDPESLLTSLDRLKDHSIAGIKTYLKENAVNKKEMSEEQPEMNVGMEQIVPKKTGILNINSNS